MFRNLSSKINHSFELKMCDNKINIFNSLTWISIQVVAHMKNEADVYFIYLRFNLGGGVQLREFYSNKKTKKGKMIGFYEKKPWKAVFRSNRARINNEKSTTNDACCEDTAILLEGPGD
ncbi:hypothetical protein CWI37_1549p0010 [Hamiltosporidium tvaerminnensis]|uniref:Uncharacterized protein n=1 Tax=Hamiltosporidium tvaerminnensis TaxID=1176355 RepID=A0A4Q9KWZ1_9MICR|nr:hypothetical protein CWI37_1549p0010 [Hamiltosporidium tvaerminnensis]